MNTWLAFEFEAAALALVRDWGIVDEALPSAITGSPLVSPYAASKLKKMQLGDDSPDVALGLALEDLTLVEESRGSTLSPVVGVIERWRGLVVQGAGALDISAARLGLGSD